jgi:hypothetical protein
MLFIKDTKDPSDYHFSLSNFFGETKPPISIQYQT